MESLIASIRKSVDDENWYAALYLSLTAPDICARLESEDSMTSRARYVAWFDRYLADDYRHPVGADQRMHVFLGGNDCYALRCSLLHEGGTDISHQRCQEVLSRFHFTVVGSHCNQINSILQLDVPTFCLDVCKAVENWLKDFKVHYPDKLHRLDELLTVYVGPHDMGAGIRFGSSK